IFADRIVAADRLIGPEDARLHRAGQPCEVRLPQDMMMRLDNVGNAALLVPSDSRCETTAALDPPSTRSSTKRRIAISASVCGRNPGVVRTGGHQPTCAPLPHS